MTEDVMFSAFRENAAKELEKAISDIRTECQEWQSQDIRYGLRVAENILWDRIGKLMPEWFDEDE